MKLKRKRKKKKKVTLVLGVGWYREDQWPIFLQYSVDREDLNQTYAEWLEKAQNNMKNIAEPGYQPVKIPVDVRDMVKWCKSKGVALNGEARAAYIAKKTRENFG